MIIDAHIHVGRWGHADFLGRETTVTETTRVLKEAGAGGGALMPTDDFDNAGLLAAIDADATGLALWMFAWLRPVSHDAGAADLAWAESHAKRITGIKLHPSLSRVRVTDDAFRPALELAKRADLVVLIHCGRWQEIASYRFAIEAAESFPSVRFLLAHAGGDTPPLATAAAALVHERALKNVWFDFSGLREYWVIERNARLIGADRYLFGSDYALAHPNMYIGAVRAMDLPEDDKNKILGGNAEQLFGTPVNTPDGTRG